MNLFPATTATHAARYFLIIAFFFALPVWADTIYLVGRIRKVNEDQIVIQINGERMPTPGDVGLIGSYEEPIAKARTVRVDGNRLFAVIPAHTLERRPRLGDKVFFPTLFPLPFVKPVERKRIDPRLETKPTSPLPSPSDPPTVTSATEQEPTPKPEQKSVPPPMTSPTPASEEPEFTPLLAPITVKAKSARTRSENLFHGRLRAREIFQQIRPSNERTWLTRLDSDGSLDRLFSQPWSLNWSGNVRYRDGNRPSTALDYHDPQAYVYRLILAGNITKRMGLNLGRFIPFELPGLGYVDGGKLNFKKSQRVQLGVMAGSRPDRETLGFAGKEAMGASYIAYQNGRPGAMYYSGTLGVLRTTFNGQADELAVLYDHRSDLTRFFNLSVTSQIDFNGGAAKINKDPRLTRLDAYLTSRLFPFLALRGGVNHFERPDTAAERYISGEDNLDAIRKSGSWRYSGGSTQNLPLRLSLDEEISYYDNNEGRSKGFWRISLSRYGLFAIQQGRVTVSGFNLSEFEGEGHGGQVALSLPFKNNHFWFDSIYGFRYSGHAGETKKYSTSDMSERLIYRTGKHWDVDMGFSRVFQQGIRSTVADLGISYHW